MILTDDWKAGKYNSGFYYYEDTNGKVCIARWHELNPTVCVEILDKVPDYSYISELESKNKHLLDLQANQDKEVERLRNENEELIGLRKEVAKGEEIIGKLLNEGNVLAVKNRKLRELLEECKTSVLFNSDVTRGLEGKNSSNYKNLLNLSTRINEALGNE